ncbi:MAG: hypothetical protein HBSIN02_15120 [Bacteroidia bacterium]|nr:MAG: hypothetical protein HBSIN02_15120 [Bacteroidia bacterium]
MTRWHAGLREAAIIALSASVFGFVYTGIMRKGLFAEGYSQESAVSRPGSPSTIIHVDEARELYESGRALFIDARHPFEFAMGHIPNAINIPLGEFEKRESQIDSLPRDKVLVTYCDGVQCNSSIGLAARLREAGFQNVQIFFGGWNEWQARNLPITKSMQ